VSELSEDCQARLWLCQLASQALIEETHSMLSAQRAPAGKASFKACMPRLFSLDFSCHQLLSQDCVHLPEMDQLNLFWHNSLILVAMSSSIKCAWSHSSKRLFLQHGLASLDQVLQTTHTCGGAFF